MTDQPTSGGSYTRDPVTGQLTPEVEAPVADPAPVERQAEETPADPAPSTSKKGGK